MQRLWDYIEWVKDNPRCTSKWVKLAVKRFENDLKKSKDPDYPYRFDINKAQLFIDFSEMLKQYKDVWAGEPLHLEPWQVFVFGNIYGWVYKDTGLRRFRKAFTFIGRKNGKSTMVSSVLLFDNLLTPGAEGYCASTRKEQSRIVFDNVVNMIRQHEDLKKMLKVYNSTYTVVNPSNSSKISALSSEYSTFDGLNPSTATIDEVAAMKTYDIIQVLQSGTTSRPEPLLFEITSGSDNTNSAGAQEFERSQKILEGVFEDDSYFCILYTLDKTDSWTDETKWIKANPNLGVSVNLDTLRSLCLEAQQNPSLEAEFRIKNCGLFISPVTAWIPFDKWKRCERKKPKDLNLHECVAVAAVDLSKRLDFTAFDIAIYHIPSNTFYMEHRFYIPSEQIKPKCKTDSPLIYKWIEQNYITAIEGETIQYDKMFEDIMLCIEKYKIQEVLYDPYNAGQLITEMGPYCDLVEVKQNMKNISPMAKDFEAAIYEGRIVDDNPVMAWMVSNCDIYRDQNGNIKPVKHGGKDSSHHIDGVVTSLLAVGRIKSLVDNGYIDTRTPEQISADVTSRLSEIDY